MTCAFKTSLNESLFNFSDIERQIGSTISGIQKYLANTFRGL